jgi:hypothetical protein
VIVFGFIVPVEETFLQANILTPSQFRELPRHVDSIDTSTGVMICWLMGTDSMQIPGRICGKASCHTMMQVALQSVQEASNDLETPNGACESKEVQYYHQEVGTAIQKGVETKKGQD